MFLSQTPAVMLAYLVIAGGFLTHIRKPMTQMTVKEQRLEGEYRHIHSRLITNSEEIAFYRGNSREKLTLLSSFHKLVSIQFNFLTPTITIDLTLIHSKPGETSAWALGVQSRDGHHRQLCWKMWVIVFFD